MRHDEASRYLPALVAGELEEPLRSTIEQHAADCPACRDWREAHREVTDAMTAGAGGSSHPSSAELAAWALELEEPSAGDLAHLASCASCHEEVELARDAVLEARAATSLGARAARRAGGSRRARLALAAACVGVVLAGGLLWRSVGSQPDAFDMSNETLAGHRLIAAQSSIRAEAVEIEQGSEIVFEAGDVITLGNGFVVAEGATFAATTSGTEEPSSNGV